MNNLENILDDFYKITNRDIASYLKQCTAFFATGYNQIVQFYSGNTKITISTAFKNFLDIRKATDDLFEVIQSNSKRMNDTRYWQLIDIIESIDSSLLTLAKINKWARSSNATVGYNSGLTIQYTLSQNQTLERVAQDVLLSQNPEDDWVSIAWQNQLREEDYTVEGGVGLQLKTAQNNFNFVLDSVVAVISGDSVLGLDICANWTFQNDDILVLNPTDTQTQSLNILTNLKRNDNPDRRQDGVQSGLIVGSNRGTLNFPLIISQLQKTFATDDCFKNFTVTKVSVEADNAYIEYSVQNRLGEIIADSANI